MKIRMEHKSGGCLTWDAIETTLDQFLEINSDSIDAAEAAKITAELQTTGHARIAGFVGAYVDLTRMDTP